MYRFVLNVQVFTVLSDLLLSSLTINCKGVNKMDLHVLNETNKIALFEHTKL